MGTKPLRLNSPRDADSLDVFGAGTVTAIPALSNGPHPSLLLNLHAMAKEAAAGDILGQIDARRGVNSPADT